MVDQPAVGLRNELAEQDPRDHDPRADPATYAEAALRQAAGTDKQAAFEHGPAAVDKLAQRIDAARTGACAEAGTIG